jgi:trans-aconitate 2-methyltransferase
MLEKSAAFAAPGLTFVQGDIGAVGSASAPIGDGRASGPFDVVLSNAALHWVPDHPGLFARLVSLLGPGGQLAVQMPAMFEQPSHTIARALGEESPYREALAGYRLPAGLLPLTEYVRLLHGLGLRDVRARIVAYPHLLPSREAVIEWVKGTLLAAYRARLASDLYASLVSAYGTRLAQALPDERPFLFPFMRMFLGGTRG